MPIQGVECSRGTLDYVTISQRLIVIGFCHVPCAMSKISIHLPLSSATKYGYPVNGVLSGCKTSRDIGTDPLAVCLGNISTGHQPFCNAQACPCGWRTSDIKGSVKHEYRNVPLIIFHKLARRCQSSRQGQPIYDANVRRQG